MAAGQHDSPVKTTRLDPRHDKFPELSGLSLKQRMNNYKQVEKKPKTPKLYNMKTTQLFVICYHFSVNAEY